jgi:hypothetical protein
MTMDEWLANVYGTGGAPEQVDLEKMAQLAILEKLANEEGYDLSGLTEEQAIALANEVMAAGSQDGETQQEPEQQEQQDPEQVEMELAKEAQAKFEEADFLGRVMAHAYTQELEKIAQEKQAFVGQNSPVHLGPGEMPDVGGLGRTDAPSTAAAGSQPNREHGPTRADYSRKKQIMDKVREKATAAKGAVKGVAKRYGELMRGGKELGMGGSVQAGVGRAGNKKLLSSLALGGRNRAEALKSLGARGGTAAGAAALGYGAYKALGGGKSKSEKSKEAEDLSVFEKLAEERAAEMLMANNVDPETGDIPQQEPQQGQEQQAQQEPTPDEQFEGAVDARAIEMLREAGYDVQ